jgi:hypothetical protein
MKVLWFYIAIQLTTLMMYAEKGHQENMAPSNGVTELNFQNRCFRLHGKDSVLIICDRYDRSGAGVVFKVFYPTDDHTIAIAGIPPGKYYFTIQCLGLHRDKVEKVVRIRSRKRESISIKLRDCDEFSKDHVIIPAEHPDFARLKVMNMK